MASQKLRRRPRPAIAVAYDSIAARIGDRLTLLLLIAAAWAIIARWRRSRRKQGGGDST